MFHCPIDQMPSPTQVTVIGAGNVGSTLVQRLAEKNLANVVLIDIVPGKAQGIALDLMQARAIEHHDRQIIGTDNYADSANSQVIVVTAGVPRKPGMSREDLLRINAQIISEVVPKAIAHSPEAILVMVTNPLDVITYLAWKLSGLPPYQVIGMAGALDASRFQTFIAMELGISIADITAMVMGGHGDLMVPLPRYSTVNGVPITELMTAEAIARLVDRTRNGGAEIVKLMQTGSAYFAPASAACVMVESILLNRQRIIPAAAYLNGEYQLRNLFMGVPVQIGKAGVAQVLELKLTAEELEALHNSARSVQENIATLEPLGFLA
jgi:malate dehydrogenase